MSTGFGARGLFAACHEGARMERDALLAAQMDFRLAVRRFYIGCPGMDRKMASGLVVDFPPMICLTLNNTAVVARILLDLHEIASDAEFGSLFGSDS
jgi:hypothetical protein